MNWLSSLRLYSTLIVLLEAVITMATTSSIAVSLTWSWAIIATLILTSLKLWSIIRSRSKTQPHRLASTKSVTIWALTSDISVCSKNQLTHSRKLLTLMIRSRQPITTVASLTLSLRTTLMRSRISQLPFRRVVRRLWPSMQYTIIIED